MLEAYFAAFNRGDSDGAVSNYTIPYFDIMNVDGVPVTTIVDTEEKCRKYFTVDTDSSAREWTAAIEASDVTELGPNIALSDCTWVRTTSGGDFVSRSRTTYTCVYKDGRWFIAGYTVGQL